MILHIVLLVLKIIGIVLAVLLGLVILLLCLALFVPVRYQVKASRNEGEDEPPVRVKGRVSWLFPLFQIKFLYPADVYLKCKVLFFTIFKMPSEEEKERKSSGKRKGTENQSPDIQSSDQEISDKQSSNEKNSEKKNLDEKNVNEKNPEETTGGKVEEDHIEAEEAADTESETDTDFTGEKKSEEPDIGKKKNIILRIKEIFVKIRQFFQKIRYTIETLCDRIKGIRENITYYTELLQSDAFLQAFELCKGELVSILAYIRPRKLEADLTVGTGDPASTGQVLAVYGILYPLIGNHVRVTGDFEQKRVEGTLFIKGRLTLFRFVKTACRIYFNKDIRKLIKTLKKEDA